MMRRQILILAVVTALFCPAGLQAKIAYKVIDLGTPGYAMSYAGCLNDAGQIVGHWEVWDSGRWYGWCRRAILFDSTGAGNSIDLGSLGGDISIACFINNAGQIVGWAEKNPGDWPSSYRATIFDPTGAGNNIDLSTLGGDDSEATCINNGGQIVGQAENGQGDRHATLFDPTGPANNIDLGTLGGDCSEARSINEAGQIVGWATNGQGDRHATLFDPTGAGNNIDLGTLAGLESSAYSINNSAQIVGCVEKSLGDLPIREAQYRATMFDPTGAGNNIDLGTLGGDESVAYSINDAAQIVGYAVNSQGDLRATLFDPTGGCNNTDLNSLIDPASGWILRGAYCINDSGWIVGWGWGPEGGPHAFLLVPKPPCLYALAGDLNDDCKVDFADFAVMAANWLVDCGLYPTDPACILK